MNNFACLYARSSYAGFGEPFYVNGRILVILKSVNTGMCYKSCGMLIHHLVIYVCG